jgi:hypothetical protein
MSRNSHNYGRMATLARWTLAGALLLGAAGGARAQCSDGSPPPCGPRPASTPTFKPVPGGQALLTVHYVNTPLRTIRTDLARYANRIIVATPAADTVRLTARVVEQRWDFAFKGMLDASGLEGVEDTTGVIMIKTLEEARRDAESAPLLLRIIKLQRPAAPVAAIARRLLTSKGWIEIDSLTNTIVLSERQDNIERVVTTILRLNQATTTVP